MARTTSKLGTMLQVGRTFGVRDGMLRLEYEVQRGSGLMSWRMRSVQGWDSWRLEKIAPGMTAQDALAARRAGTPRFFFRDARTLAASIRDVVGCEGEQSILVAAEKILRGSLPFFGGLSLDCGFPPRWFRNPVTGQSVDPQQPWTRMRFASPSYGDLKFILEPCRFLFVYTLVRAYALSADERFPQAFWTALEDWAHHSPPMSGPLWICGQECSLRILAWSFALQGFIHSPTTNAERMALLFSLVAAHAWRTAQTLNYARSQRSNHLISEAVGLWTAGVLYPELREAQVWRNLGAHLLQQAVLDQITPEGVSQQHSFNYQRMILHLLLWSLRLSEMAGASLPRQIRERAHAAYGFLQQWVDAASGFVPNYGSDDGSLILPLALGSYRDFRPLLQLGAAVLDRPGLRSGVWDEAALWFGAVRPAEKTDPAPHVLIDTGYFRLGDQTSWALIRAGRYARRPFQCDQLHVDLWWQGLNLARDAGTYLYNGPVPWNNGLAGSSAHNTITVDHRDQMRRAGRFLWLDWAQASGRLLRPPGEACATRFEGEHDGYKRFGITHRRAVDWLPSVGWVIVDEVGGLGVHDVRLHWLMPDLPYEVANSPFRVWLGAAPMLVRWNIFASVPGEAAIVRAGKQVWAKTGSNSAKLAGRDTPLLGWESPTYGELRPAVSLLYRTRSELPVRLATVILTGECGEVEVSDGQLVVRRGESEVYRAVFSPARTGHVKN